LPSVGGLRDRSYPRRRRGAYGAAVTSGKSTQPAPASGYLSWLITSVLAGWFVVYNIMRIRGDSPRGAALVSLAIGAAAGVVVFAIGLGGRRRLGAAGWGG